MTPDAGRGAAQKDKFPSEKNTKYVHGFPAALAPCLSVPTTTSL